MRYLVFGYSQYYPCGGMGDLMDTVETMEQVKELIRKDEWNDFFDVYDLLKKEVVTTRETKRSFFTEVIK